MKQKIRKKKKEENKKTIKQQKEKHKSLIKHKSRSQITIDGVLENEHRG